MKKEINKDYLKEQQYKTTQYLEARIKLLQKEHLCTLLKNLMHRIVFIREVDIMILSQRLNTMINSLKR